MPSSYTSNLRFTLQATGEGLNIWGNILNSGVFSLVDTAISGRYNTTASAVTLTVAQGATDEARNAILDVTGGSGTTFTAPAVSKLYFVRNASSGDVVVTTGGATNATVKAGERVPVMSDGTNYYRIRLLDMGGDRLSNLATPTSNNDAVTKAYADGLAFGSSSLPGINVGTTYMSVSNDGSAALWKRTLPVSSGSTTGQVLKSTGVDGYPEDTSQWGWDGFQGALSKSANYTLALTDRAKVVLCTSTFTLSLTAAATLGSKFYARIINNGTGLITIDPNGSETITFPGQSAKTTIVLVPGEGVDLYCDGGNFFATVCQSAGLCFSGYEGTAPTYVQDIWTTRLPSTISVNTLGLTYSSGTIQAVPPGRYIFRFRTWGFGVASFASRIYNSTASSVVLYGDLGYANDFGGGTIFGYANSGEGEVSLSATSNIALQSYSGNTAGGNRGWNFLTAPAGAGAPTKYAEILIYRVGP